MSPIISITLLYNIHMGTSRLPSPITIKFFYYLVGYVVKGLKRVYRFYLNTFRNPSCTLNGNEDKHLTRNVLFVFLRQYKAVFSNYQIYPRILMNGQWREHFTDTCWCYTSNKTLFSLLSLSDFNVHTNAKWLHILWNTLYFWRFKQSCMLVWAYWNGCMVFIT